jgi:hypothetical protein
MAWAALLVICVVNLKEVYKDEIKNKVFLLVICGLACIMILAQLHALRSPHEMLHERNLAFLALAMEVRDPERVGRIYPSINKALEISAGAYKNNISIFSSSPYREFREHSSSIGVESKNSDLPECEGFLDSVENLEDDSHYAYIKGWVFKRDSETYPEYLRFFNLNGDVVGYAITGGYRPDVASQINKKALLSGFNGYVLSNAVGSIVNAQAGNLSCQIALKIPNLNFHSYKLDLISLDGLVSIKSVLNVGEWLGSDFSKSKVPGVKVYGSYISGDANTGSILISIKRGQKVFYRSGPTGGRQLLEINGDSTSIIKIPTALDWTLLEFSGLPETKQGVQIKFIDAGDSWGEWSAIGLRDEK